MARGSFTRRLAQVRELMQQAYAHGAALPGHTLSQNSVVFRYWKRTCARSGRQYLRDWPGSAHGPDGQELPRSGWSSAQLFQYRSGAPRAHGRARDARRRARDRGAGHIAGTRRRRHPALHEIIRGRAQSLFNEAPGLDRVFSPDAAPVPRGHRWARPARSSRGSAMPTTRRTSGARIPWPKAARRRRWLRGGVRDRRIRLIRRWTGAGGGAATPQVDGAQGKEHGPREVLTVTRDGKAIAASRRRRTRRMRRSPPVAPVDPAGAPVARWRLHPAAPSFPRPLPPGASRGPSAIPPEPRLRALPVLRGRDRSAAAPARGRGPDRRDAAVRPAPPHPTRPRPWRRAHDRQRRRRAPGPAHPRRRAP